MAAHPPTPEEKLFAVIQGAASSSPRRRSGLGPQVRSLVTAVDLPRVNQALAVCLGLLAVWALVSALLWRPQVERILRQAHQQVTPLVVPPPLEGLRPLEVSVALVRDGDPFGVEGTGRVPQPTPEPPPPRAADLVADFKLVGIAWGAEPMAMIEQAGIAQTHVLRVGDAIGRARVRAIFEDRVVLAIGDEEIELF